MYRGSPVACLPPSDSVAETRDAHYAPVPQYSTCRVFRIVSILTNFADAVLNDLNAGIHSILAGVNDPDSALRSALVLRAQESRLV